VKFTPHQNKETQSVGGDAHLTRNFTVEFDNVPGGGVHTYEGLHTVSERVESGDSDDHFSRFRPGTPTVSTVTFHRDFAGTDDWFKWFKTGLDGQVERKSMAIRHLSDDLSKTGSRHNGYNCWVKKWKLSGLNSKNSGHAQESIEVVIETLEFSAG